MSESYKNCQLFLQRKRNDPEKLDRQIPQLPPRPADAVSGHWPLETADVSDVAFRIKWYELTNFAKGKEKGKC